MYCTREKGCQMISLSDEFITNVMYNKLSVIAYVTAFGIKLFNTNYIHASVTWCDHHGNILWMFCDKSIMLCPLGNSVENGRSVYLVGGRPHNLVSISPDGQSCTQLE